ncbi:MAG TPA: PEP-CTERM sorting domain-containing protein [Bryobacteraceae bacterium]|nr:PEP-CTERM sorting domain-containing protein [Bryobacteraceae bacterium]
MKLYRFLSVAALTTVLSGILCANTVILGLHGDPNQNYTFTRTDTPVAGSEYPNTVVEVPAGPYPVYIGSDIPADQYGVFCIDFLKTANFGASYPGTLISPSAQTELEAAYLASILAGYGGESANTNLYQGPISMAVWQIMDPTPGDVPRDPAAQPFVTLAQNAYASGSLLPADFPNTLIWVPNDPGIQRFLTVVPEAPEVPEPGSIGLMAGGVLLIALGCCRKAGKSAAAQEIIDRPR